VVCHTVPDGLQIVNGQPVTKWEKRQYTTGIGGADFADDFPIPFDFIFVQFNMMERQNTVTIGYKARTPTELTFHLGFSLHLGFSPIE
jgi:hypothetical protein